MSQALQGYSGNYSLNTSNGPEHYDTFGAPQQGYSWTGAAFKGANDQLASAAEAARQKERLDAQRAANEQQYNASVFGSNAGLQAARERNAADIYGMNLKQGRFDSLLPYLTGQIGSLDASFNSLNEKPIDTSPIWNPNQIQQRVNQANASTDAGTGTNIRQMRESAAGRGSGSNSPLAQALAGQARSSGLATKIGKENDLRWTAAQGNAQQVLNAQSNAAQADIGYRQPIYSLKGSLYGALAGLA